MKLTLSGLAGTGTSTVGRALASKLNLKFVSSGDFCRQLGGELNMTINQFDELCSQDPSYDRKVDQKIVEFGKSNDDFIAEGRMTWHFVPDAFAEEGDHTASQMAAYYGRVMDVLQAAGGNEDEIMEYRKRKRSADKAAEQDNLKMASTEAHGAASIEQSNIAAAKSQAQFDFESKITSTIQEQLEQKRQMAVFDALELESRRNLAQTEVEIAVASGNADRIEHASQDYLLADLAVRNQRIKAERELSVAAQQGTVAYQVQAGLMKSIEGTADSLAASFAHAVVQGKGIGTVWRDALKQLETGALTAVTKSITDQIVNASKGVLTTITGSIGGGVGGILTKIGLGGTTSSPQTLATTANTTSVNLLTASNQALLAALTGNTAATSTNSVTTGTNTTGTAVNTAAIIANTVVLAAKAIKDIAGKAIGLFKPQSSTSGPSIISGFGDFAGTANQGPAAAGARSPFGGIASLFTGIIGGIKTGITSVLSFLFKPAGGAGGAAGSVSGPASVATAALTTAMTANTATTAANVGVTTAHTGIMASHLGVMITHTGVLLGHLAAIIANTIATIANTIATAIQGVLGFFGFAEGGRPPIGVPSIVGEKGKELFIPDSAGTIIPAEKTSKILASFGTPAAPLPRAPEAPNSAFSSGYDHVPGSGGGTAINGTVNNHNTGRVGDTHFNIYGANNPRETMRQIADFEKRQTGKYSPMNS